MTSAAAIIVFARADGGRLTAADSAKVAAIATSLDGRHIPDIVSVTAGPPSPNRLVQTALVAMPNSVVNGSGTRPPTRSRRCAPTSSRWWRGRA